MDQLLYAGRIPVNRMGFAELPFVRGCEMGLQSIVWENQYGELSSGCRRAGGRWETAGLLPLRRVGGATPPSKPSSPPATRLPEVPVPTTIGVNPDKNELRKLQQKFAGSFPVVAVHSPQAVEIR